MVLDSRGNPTIEVEVSTELGRGRAIAPSGASRGKWEAVEVRDGGREFLGRGVRRAIDNVNRVIAPKLLGLDVRRQRFIDKLLCDLDGTPNKSRLGGNAIVATSLAVAKAAASSLGLSLYEYLGGSHAYVMPVPMLNLINGGAHAGNELSFQEFMIVPVGFDSFSEALRAAVEIYHVLKSVLKDRYGPLAINVGDEGGFAPPMRVNREALEALSKAVREAGYSEEQVVLAIDAAASHIYADGSYGVDGRKLSREDLIDYYLSLVDEYPIRSIEDPLHEEDFEGFAELTAKLSKRGVMVVGDDLFVTNVRRLRRGLELRSATAVLVKVNQIGTLTEAVEFIHTAQDAGLRAIVSHRSGDSEDPAIAHIAVALRTGLIKAGAPARSERTAKYNELLRIEEELAGSAVYPGSSALRPGTPLATL
jgi:enolase